MLRYTIVALAACGGGAAAPMTTSAAVTAAGDHGRCGWIAAGDEDGYDTFAAHAPWFDAIHPKWFELADDGTLRVLPGADDRRVLDAARRHGVAIEPLVASLRDPARLRATLGEPRRRAAHVEALVALAVERGYDGLDIDYEALWGEADRSLYESFIDELVVAMHAAGKRVSAAVPGQADDRRARAYDYGFLAARLDRVHVMAFDLHTVGTHGGPVAPQGWVDAVIVRLAATGAPERFVLGVPNYGVTPTWSGGTLQATARCDAGYAVDDDHMATCPRGRWDAGRAPHCETPDGRLYFDDLRSLEHKVAAARAAGLGGVTYWRLGDEPAGFFEMVRRHFP